jgi:2-aminoadipate transaminase
LRLGWLVADPPVFEKLVAAKYASDLSSDALVQRAVYALLSDGTLVRHLRRARSVYRERRDALVHALHDHADDVQFDTPEGGFNLWLELPQHGPTSTDLFLEALRAGVAFVPGPFFFSTGPGSAAALRGLRLSYSALQTDDIARGVHLLADSLRMMLNAARTGESVVY